VRKAAVSPPPVKEFKMPEHPARFVLLAGVFAGVSACTMVTPEPRPQPEPGADTCASTQMQRLVGQPATVLETMEFANPVRIIRPGTAVTMDYNESRMNIAVDRAGRISRVYCG